MKIRHLLCAFLAASFGPLPSAFAEDKKKDKTAENQKQLSEQQKIQQWKFEQMSPGNTEVVVGDSDTKIADFLRVHNQARAAVGVGPLKWSAKLAQTAQKWADQLAATGQFAHNPATTYGENIAGQSPPFTPAGGAKMWLEEKKDYQPGQPGGGNAGHYTQMVWRQTTHVGYGVAKVKGMTVIVANYEPAGNKNNEPPY